MRSYSELCNSVASLSSFSLSLRLKKKKKSAPPPPMTHNAPTATPMINGNEDDDEPLDGDWTGTSSIKVVAVNDASLLDVAEGVPVDVVVDGVPVDIAVKGVPIDVDVKCVFIDVDVDAPVAVNVCGKDCVPLQSPKSSKNVESPPAMHKRLVSFRSVITTLLFSVNVLRNRFAGFSAVNSANVILGTDTFAEAATSVSLPALSLIRTESGLVLITLSVNCRSTRTRVQLPSNFKRARSGTSASKFGTTESSTKSPESAVRSLQLGESKKNGCGGGGSEKVTSASRRRSLEPLANATPTSVDAKTTFFDAMSVSLV